MNEDSTRRMFWSVLPFATFELVVFLGAVAHLSHRGFTTAAAWGESALPILISSPVVYIAYRITQSELTKGPALRVFTIMLGSVCFGIVVTLFITLMFAVRGELFGDTAYIFLLTATAGSASGAPIGFFYIELQLRSDRLAARNREIAELNKRLSISNRALRHNLRNELNIIIGMTDVLEESVDDSRQSEFKTLKRHEIQLLRLSDKSRDLRTIWTTDDLVPIELRKEISEAIQQATECGLLGECQVTLNIQDDCTVTAHPKLNLAIEEAIKNAYQHNRDAELSITVSVRKHGEYGRIEIADTGFGIPESEREVLESPVETSLQHGMGLGLWLINSVVTQSKGSLSFTDNEPTGAIVILDLPLVTATEDNSTWLDKTILNAVLE